ncbi:uncharacterized protein LOC111378895 [Olea europaea var. sylvestris]|uniref:uncharacterized protein LOC111378895 n=1 Tax=Olea europaea var. sylvestris TaxID=158386 RepID=UPI000C1D774C|nr:uncharacterized protein LOC111378895 [Olea europaea var. sylvestris]
MNVDNIDEGVLNDVEFDVTKLSTDPGLRILISDYNANIRDEVRRAYMLKGLCQPQDHDFPKRQFGVTIRRFNPSWFKEFSSWFEYSVEKDAAYYLYCYLFRTSSGKQGGGESFVGEVLLRQGHSFRGHDESEDSLNPGKLLVQLQFLATQNEAIHAVTLGNAPHNCKLTSLDVQKDIVNACAIETINVLSKIYNLSMSRLRRQGYDGVSNMQGKFNGLKTLILNESPCAFYIHCFAHQLQLALVVVVKKNIPITNFFRVVGDVINTVGASSKRCELLREKQLDFIVEALEKCEILSGRGLNQETTLQRSDVLAMIVEDESCSCDQRSDATNLLELIQKFDFAFNLQLMRSVLGMSNELSKALQRKDQDIVNAMQLVKLCKRRLQIMRDEGWDSFLKEVFLFYSVIDLQIQELNDHFSEVNTELLLCVACLCPQDSFSSFDKKSLIRLGELYPLDFSAVDVIVLNDQLETYIFDMSSNNEFEGLNDLGDLAKKLVLTKKDRLYSLVYRLLTLTLILTVATATMERVFSAMSIVNDRLRNRMGDQWINDSTITLNVV